MLADGIVTTPTTVAASIRRLRDARRRLLAERGPAKMQRLAVDAVCKIAARWRDPGYPPRQAAQERPGVFAFPMVWVNLEALIESLNPDRLWALIDAEGCRGKAGPDVIAHVLASNTPLLGWTSAIRALLVGSGSLIKAPAAASGAWVEYFERSLADVSPQLAGLVEAARWSGGARDIEGAVWAGADLIVAYGADETISDIMARSGGRIPVLGYGHRATAAYVTAGSDYSDAARGLATDVLMYDQGGCLSPQTIFVEGEVASALRFGKMLAAEMDASALPRPAPDPVRAARVDEARALAGFEDRTVILGAEDRRWTVVVRETSKFVASGGHGVVSIAPMTDGGLESALSPIRGRLQGFAIARSAGDESRAYESAAAAARGAGASYICLPGELQRPPIDWRENNLDVLGSLLLR